MTVLVVAAHPDDETLGCGATMARLADRGDEVHVLVLGEGATSRSRERASADRGQVQQLESDSRRAVEILGVASMEFAGLPDNRFDGLDLLDIVKRVEDSVARLSPEVVFSQHGGDLNMDHALTYRAVVTATRPTADNPVRTVYAYRAASSTEWAFASFAPKFRPNVFVDATGYVDRKLAALRCYESEVRPFPHPRAIEAVRAEAQYWGSIAGFDAAEAFELVRSIHGPEDLPMG